MEDPITKIQNEILDQYANDENPRPWIVAFSGGSFRRQKPHSE